MSRPPRFRSVPANDPARRGQRAAPKQFSADYRYAVAPVHTRCDAVQWFVWDAEGITPPEPCPVIRQGATLEEAIAGLDW